MASRTFLFLVLFASTVSVILSVPPMNPLLLRPEPPNLSLQVEPNNANQNEELPDNINLPKINPRTFGSLFNLSAYLQGAPNDSAALNFIPLITILSALG